MPRRNPEQAVQRAVFQHIRACGVAGLVAIHVPNGGFRRLTEAKILVGLGVTAGVPDILLWHDGKSFALELKAGAGQVSSAQVLTCSTSPGSSTGTRQKRIYLSSLPVMSVAPSGVKTTEFTGP